MRKPAGLLLLFFIIFSATGCLKDNSCQDKTIQSEAAPIAAYATANGINGTVHSSGVYYQVVTPGSGPVPTLASQVAVRYTGKLLDGTVFDAQTGTPATLLLGGTIPGWQIGLQQLQEGGTIKLIIPSTLAYGCSGIGSIPGNSILYFEIQLVDVI